MNYGGSPLEKLGGDRSSHRNPGFMSYAVWNGISIPLHPGAVHLANSTAGAVPFLSGCFFRVRPTHPPMSHSVVTGVLSCGDEVPPLEVMEGSTY